MKEIIINDKKIVEEDISMEVIRLKALIINSKNNIILEYNNNTYQLPGGHLENNENMDECIKREIKEETGIILEEVDAPFLCITTYDDDYFNTGMKVKNTIYYYKILTDKEVDLEKTEYDELEQKTEFKLIRLPFDDLEEFINKNVINKKIDKKIAREMAVVLKEYKEREEVL